MSFLETIACNNQDELIDWLGGKIGDLLAAHAAFMADTLPFADEIPLHPFLSTGLAEMILADINGEQIEEPKYDLSEFVKLARA